MTARAAYCIGASVRLFVCLSVAKMQKPDFLKNFRAMVSIDDL